MKRTKVETELFLRCLRVGTYVVYTDPKTGYDKYGTVIGFVEYKTENSYTTVKIKWNNGKISAVNPDNLRVSNRSLLEE